MFADQAATPDLEEAGIAPQWQSINYDEAFFDSIGQTQKSGRSPGRSVLPSEADIHQSYQSFRSRGSDLSASNNFPRGYRESLDIINNWRSSRNFPLNTFHIGLRRRAKAIDSGSITARRIKRMTSIEAKLAR